jgi:uncharacterized protein with NRDE domain
MCLLVLAWKTHPRYRVVLAANRDEFHARPATALDWWGEPCMLAGRDLQAGGTWLAVGTDGRFGVVTNYRDMQGPLAGAPSRGELIPEFLASDELTHEFAARLAPQVGRYSGFNLLVGDSQRLFYIANRTATPARELANGVHGLSNHLLDTPWPKLVRTRTRFEQLLSGQSLVRDELFEMLTDPLPTQDHGLAGSELPPELERALSAPFIVHDRYGTRASTVMLVGYDGSVEIAEQRYDPQGRIIGKQTFEFKS